MLNRIVKIFFLLIIIIICINSTLMAQDYLSNLNSYISSDKSELSFYMDVRQIKENFPESYDSISPNMGMVTDNPAIKYYNELLESGIDIVEMTEYIFGAIENMSNKEQIDDANNVDNIEFMVALYGDFPLTPFKNYFAKKSEFIESGTNKVKTFINKNEEVSITIINEKVLIITPIEESEAVSSRIIQGTGLKNGNIARIVEKAKQKYDLMFVVMDMESYGPIDMIRLKENSSYISSLADIPDEMEFISFTFGIYSNGDDGFNMEFETEGANPNEMELLSAAANQTLMLVKSFVPILIGSAFSEKEATEETATNETGEETSANETGEEPNPNITEDVENESNTKDFIDDTPILTDEQQLELTHFIHSITLTQEDNVIILLISFPKSILLIFEEIAKSYN